MKKKINFHFLVIGSFAVCTTLLAVVVLCYNIIVSQASDDLAVYGEFIIDSGLYEEANMDFIDSATIRVTLIDDKGEVYYDNRGDLNNMNNHSDRPEVVAAIKKGYGRDVRMSETMSSNTVYYAVRLQDGSILRLARDVYSVFHMFVSFIPIFLFVGIAIICICAIYANVLTKNIVRPIEKAADNLDDNNYSVEYEELEPIISSIRENHKRAMSAVMMRQEFTANVSHELKTPLTAISGYGELIESGMAQDERDVIRFAGEIRKNAVRLLTLINDIIKLSELDSALTVDLLDDIDLCDIVDGCKNEIEINAKKHNINIYFNVISCMVKANKDMMEEILYNLCDNAIRYNKEGGSVYVDVYKKSGKAVLAVRDTGIGIPKEHQERVFERFYRVDKSRSKLTGGTGLGLAIVKHMAAKQNATIGLESQVNEGTCISIIFSE